MVKKGLIVRILPPQWSGMPSGGRRRSYTWPGNLPVTFLQWPGDPWGIGWGMGIFVAALDMRCGEEKWGYSLSSDMTDLHGFDLDGSGNVSLMGRTGSVQEYEGFGTVTLWMGQI